MGISIIKEIFAKFFQAVEDNELEGADYGSGKESKKIKLEKGAPKGKKPSSVE